MRKYVWVYPIVWKLLRSSQQHHVAVEIAWKHFWIVAEKTCTMSQATIIVRRVLFARGLTTRAHADNCWSWRYVGEHEPGRALGPRHTVSRVWVFLGANNWWWHRDERWRVRQTARACWRDYPAHWLCLQQWRSFCVLSLWLWMQEVGWWSLFKRLSAEDVSNYCLAGEVGNWTGHFGST